MIPAATATILPMMNTIKKSVERKKQSTCAETLSVVCVQCEKKKRYRDQKKKRGKSEYYERMGRREGLLEESEWIYVPRLQ